MIPRLPLLIVLVGALAQAQDAGPPAADATRAAVVVRVPADAKVYFDDRLMQKTGLLRTFLSPPLEQGSEYVYHVRAEIIRGGKVTMQTKDVVVRAGDTTEADFSKLGEPVAQTPVAPLPPPDIGWPRRIQADGDVLTIYQPQVEKWQKNVLDARAAVSVQTGAAAQPIYGVIWIRARTDVDKEHREVTLDNFQITKINFPSAPAEADTYKQLFQKALPATRTIALDRIVANLALTRAENVSKTVPVKNQPPRIIVSTKPAILVLIDGPPVLRQVEGSKLLRVINSRALILFDQAAGKYYLRVMDRWLVAPALPGPWTAPEDLPVGINTVLNAVADEPQIDLMENLPPDVREAFTDESVPVVYVSTVPTELIDMQGQPDVAPVDGTKLLWVRNSTDPILLDTVSQDYYVLLSGRWFKSRTLDGPWSYVPANRLPADFAKIPETHPRGDVLSSVAGTPQAQEAVIANQIPQTATVNKSEAKLQPTYDGAPQFQPIPSTPLQYAANSPTPVIEVDPNSYYAVENGIWFTAPSPTGPWQVATQVPPVIYTIPPDSPIYDVTYVNIYNSGPDTVDVGYSPGYLGAYVCPEDVVVYGTGWAFPAWIGNTWIGRPWSYGWNARFCWTPGGWGFGFATSAGRPWWGPIGWNAGWGGNAWRSGWRNGWGGSYAQAHINNINFANMNLYHRWGDNVRVMRTGAASVATGVSAMRGMNTIVAGPGGNVYRRAGGGWEVRGSGTWEPYRGGMPSASANIINQLNSEWTARRFGEANYMNFRAATGNFGAPRTVAPLGGFAGFHGGYGGFRGYGGYHPSFGGYHGGGGGGRRR